MKKIILILGLFYLQTGSTHGAWFTVTSAVTYERKSCWDYIFCRLHQRNVTSDIQIRCNIWQTSYPGTCNINNSGNHNLYVKGECKVLEIENNINKKIEWRSYPITEIIAPGNFKVIACKT